MLAAGEPWPQASESGLWRARLAFEEATGVLVSSLEPTAVAIREISAGLESPAKPAAFARTRKLFDDRTGVVAKAAEATLYAQQMDHLARQTQYSKLSINAAFWVSLLAALAALLAVSAGPLARLAVSVVARSGNARMLLILERLATLAGRPYVTSALGRSTGPVGGLLGESVAARSLAMELTEEVGEEAFGDALAQWRQIEMGTLEEWDWAKTAATALGATTGTLTAAMIAPYLSTRTPGAPGAVHAFLRYPGRMLNSGLSNMAASPVGSMMANGVVYGQWVPPTAGSLLGAFMGGAGRTNTISPFSAEVANAVLYPAATLAGVVNDALATDQSSPRGTGTAQTPSGSVDVVPGTAAHDRADLAQPQAPVRIDKAGAPTGPLSPAIPTPRHPTGLDQPSNTPQTPSTDRDPSDDTTAAESAARHHPGHAPEIAPQPDEAVPRQPDRRASGPPAAPDTDAVSGTLPDAGTTGSGATASSTASSAASGQDTRPADRAEPSKGSIEGLINRWSEAAGSVGAADARIGGDRPVRYDDRMIAVTAKWRPILEEKLERGAGSTFSRKQLRTIGAEVEAIAADYTESGVDFSQIRVQEILDALDSGDPLVLVVEGIGPYFVDYGGPMTDENVIPADRTGLRLLGALVTSLRERAPAADIRVASLWDDYNDISEHHPDGRPDLQFTSESISEFRSSIVDRLKDADAVSADATEGTDFHLFQESTLTGQANELVDRLEVAGVVQRNGDRIHFVNPDFRNPLFHKFGLRTPNKWLCVALDGAQLQALHTDVLTGYPGDPASLRIMKIVALPFYMKAQQGQLREILNVLDGELNIEYHNIFYDPAGDLTAISNIVAMQFRAT